MAISNRRQKVMQDKDGIWLSATLACERTGLKRAELYRRAMAGEIRHQGENPKGNPAWFLEVEITAIVRAKLATASDAVPKATAKPKRKMTDAELEASYTRQWKKEVEEDRNLYAQNLGLTHGRRAGSAGPVAAHQERIMRFEISEGIKKKSDPKP